MISETNIHHEIWFDKTNDSLYIKIRVDRSDGKHGIIYRITAEQLQKLPQIAEGCQYPISWLGAELA